MPDASLSLMTAFMVGLLGGVHCLSMCGGIVAALSAGRGQSAPPSHLLAYNLGRIASYSLAGAIMGGLGVLLVSWLPLAVAQRLLLGLAGVVMVLLGFYLSGWWRILGHVETLGRRFWRYLEPWGRRWIPPRTPLQALMVGAIWGWLPCGLVYSLLISATASGGPLSGALVMLAFGLGTLPNLLLLGSLAGASARLLDSLWVRRVAGLVVMAFGLLSLGRAF